MFAMPPTPAPTYYATAPAAQSDAENTTIEALGEGTLEMIWTGTGFDVCGSGSIHSTVRVAGVWTLTASVVGGIPAVATSQALSFSPCVFLPTGGLPAGTVVADFSYVGAGTGLLVHSIGNGTWSPATGGRAATFDFTPTDGP